MSRPAGQPDFHIWEGQYAHLRDVPGRGAGFASDRWIESSFSRLHEQRARGEDNLPTYCSSLASVVGALVLAQRGSLRVLDFGGGAALTYAQLLNALGDPARLEYHIVENARLTERGRVELAGDHRVVFHDRLPDLAAPPDIVHAQSSIQYVDQWQDLLTRLAKYGATYLLLTDVPAGRMETFASGQNAYESVIPHWFFNLDDVIRALEPAYGLIVRSRFLGQYLGVYGGYPQDNFPPDRRIGMSWNLLFQHRGGTGNGGSR